MNNEKFYFKTLTLARESRGLTQKELADKTEIPQSTISKIESGFLNISEDDLNKVSTALNYPTSFFHRNMEIYPANLHYRKKANLNIKTLAKAEAQMNIYKANVEELLKANPLSGYYVPSWQDLQGLSPQDVAIYLRNFWQIPKGAIKNLTKLVEEKGIIVIHCEFDSDNISGKSICTSQGTPIIFINKNLSSDRQRYTLAHELGHIIMHVFSPHSFEVNVEQEAYLFASEFLMPKEQIYHYLNNLTIAKLADLKRIWLVSMQAIVYWATTLKAITPNQAKYLWAQFSSLRMRLKEPFEFPKEEPTILLGLVKHYTDSLNYQVEKLAALLSLSVKEFKEKYLDSPNSMRIIK